MRYIFTYLFITCCTVSSLRAQFTVSGTVLDINKINYVERVRVISTGGNLAITDSMGRYTIPVTEKDSLYFFYNNKPTQKFPVRTIPNPAQFDISLRLNIPGKYSVMKEVTVYSKSHRQDSLENREDYAKIFSYEKPGVSSSMVPGGVPGANLDELINIFRFKRNKRLRSFQLRLQEQEEDNYVDYRFNKTSVRRITGLTGDALDSFMVWYRPSYTFSVASDELTFNQYVLNAYYQFKKLVVTSPAKKEEGH